MRKRKPREGLFWFYTILYVWLREGGGWGEKVKMGKREAKGGKRRFSTKWQKMSIWSSSIPIPTTAYMNSDQVLYEFRPQLM